MWPAVLDQIDWLTSLWPQYSSESTRPLRLFSNTVTSPSWFSKWQQKCPLFSLWTKAAAHVAHHCARWCCLPEVCSVSYCLQQAEDVNRLPLCYPLSAVCVAGGLSVMILFNQMWLYSKHSNQLQMINTWALDTWHGGLFSVECQRSAHVTLLTVLFRSVCNLLIHLWHGMIYLSSLLTSVDHVHLCLP